MKTKKPKIGPRETEKLLMDYKQDAKIDAAEISRLQNKLAESYAANRVIADKLTDLEQKIHEGKIWNKENPRWTPRVQQALALAEKESESRNATYVGTEHILLGLLKQDEGVASHHFRASEMTYEKVSYAIKVSRCS